MWTAAPPAATVGSRPKEFQRSPPKKNPPTPASASAVNAQESAAGIPDLECFGPPELGLDSTSPIILINVSYSNVADEFSDEYPSPQKMVVAFGGYLTYNA